MQLLDDGSVRHALGIGLTIAMGAACVSPVAAQETAREVWPELDVWAQLSPKVKLFFPISELSSPCRRCVARRCRSL